MSSPTAVSGPLARSAATAALRRQQRINELCAAAIRALSGQEALHFRGQGLYRGPHRVPMPAPHLHPSPERDGMDSFRGAADGMALRLRHSDPGLHARLCPEPTAERLVFEMLEQFRVESLAQEPMAGVRANLSRRFLHWSSAFESSQLTETVQGMVLFTVAQMCRARITAEPIPEATQDVIESTRFTLAARLGTDLAALRRQRFSQADFACPARRIAATVAAQLETGESAERRNRQDGKEPLFSLLHDFEPDGDSTLPVAASGHSRVLADADGQYRVYTTAYDEQRDIASLIRPALLREYRRRLDTVIEKQGINVHRLGRRLKALFAAEVPDGWDGGQEEGRIDGRRLAQLVSSPTERRVFQTEALDARTEAAVTFLIDCSGSMKEFQEPVAVLVDVYARALELAGVRCEILGFTTGAWHGGRARRDWLRAGRPPHPGRLNEVRHLVFKDADTPWRRARQGIAGLLKGDLFKEGADGEAVAWACGRLRERGGGRNLLLVISDGSPMDGATQLANDGQYLEHHLRMVVAEQEEARAVEVFGVGVGLDLGQYYRRAQALDLSAGTNSAVAAEVLAVLAGR